ncbi:MAG: histidine triad nucleotide-binding protein [Alphaproteobacteria bacterium]|nr:histidine triad nucleotide-binding protein [Alphaproteobacteria bacterium]
MTYDPNNIFAKILRGEIPCKSLYEDDFVLAFHDIQPQAPIHALVIPKGPYQNQDAFAVQATEAEIVGFTRALGKVAAMVGLVEGGYRSISNCGANGGQEVPHYHVHLLGGGSLGRMVSKKD